MLEDRYVGDVGDFGKYGLLKALCLPSKVSGGSNLSLGVVWYLVPNEPGTGDGKHTRYLKDSPKNQGLYRSCDPGLYDSLRDIVCGHRRCLSAIRHEGILPSGTVFYEEPLTFESMPGIGPNQRDRRLTDRSEWVRQAQDQVTGCDLVFIDPDNQPRPIAIYFPKGLSNCFRDAGESTGISLPTPGRASQLTEVSQRR